MESEDGPSGRGWWGYEMTCCEIYGPPDEQHFHRNELGWITVSCEIFTEPVCKCVNKHTRKII